MGVDVLDEPEPMAAIRIIDQDMTAVIRVDARHDRQKRVEINGMRGQETFRRLSNDDNGRRMFAATGRETPMQASRVHAGKINPHWRARRAMPASCDTEPDAM